MVHAFDLLGLPRSGMLAVTMPCFGTTDRTYQNACRLAKAYGATLREIPIQKSVRQHFADIGQDESVHDVTYENSQARERTQVLMDLANQCGGIVVGTGDLSELALGWATYNGDHMSMYAVNASIPKTLVRYLVQYEASKTPEALRAVLRPSVRNCCRQNQTVRLHRKQKIWLALMSCTTSSCIMCCGLDSRRLKFIIWHKKHWAESMKQQSS